MLMKYRMIPHDDVKTKNDKDAKRNDDTNHDDILVLKHDTQNDERRNRRLGLFDHF